MTKTKVVIPGKDPESEAIRNWICGNRQSNFVLATDVLTLSSVIAPVHGRPDSGGYLLIAPRDQQLMEQMRSRYPALATIDHVSRLGEAGYDFIGNLSCLTQFAAIARAAGETFTPPGEVREAAIAAAVSGGLPAFARQIWAEDKKPGLPRDGAASALAPPRTVLTAPCQKEARVRWNDDRDEREQEPAWRTTYAGWHDDIVTRYAALWGVRSEQDAKPFGIAGQPIILDCGTRQAPDDPRLILCRVEADPVHGHELDQLIARTESWAFDALYRDGAGSVPAMLGADLVFVFVGPGAPDDAAPWAVVALADGTRRALFAEIAEPTTRAGWGALDLVCAGMAAADRVSLIWRSPDGSPSTRLRDVATRMLDQLLGGNRPLVAWRTSWLQFLHHTDRHAFERLRRELALRAQHPDKRVRREELSQGTQAYFLDHVRPTLGLDGDNCVAVCDDTVLCSFEIDADIALELYHLHYRDHLDIACRSFRVHFFYANCIVFEWSAAGQDDELTAVVRAPEETSWWMKLLDKARNGVPASWQTLAEFLDGNRHARFIYSPFHADPERELGARHVIAGTVNGQPVSPVLFGMGFSETEAGEPINPRAPQGWLRALVCATFSAAFGADQSELLARALESDGTLGQLRLVEDERAHVIASAVLAGSRPGSPSTATTYDALLYRAVDVEAFGPGFPCDEAFAHRELNKSHYARFAGFGSDFLVSDHSFAYLGFGFYALNEIHEKHMRTTYRRMFLFAQFHAAILNVFTVDFRQAHRDDDEWRQAEILSSFGRFTSQVWCDEVTTQIEGTDLFDRMRERANADSKYDYLHGEIEEASERAHNQIAAVLSILGLLGAGFLFISAPVHEIGRCLIGQLDIFGQFPFLFALAYGLVWGVDRLVKHSIGRSPMMRIWGLRYLAPVRIPDDRGWLRYRAGAAGMVFALLLAVPLVFNLLQYRGFQHCSKAASVVSVHGQQKTASVAPAAASHAGTVARTKSRSSR